MNRDPWRTRPLGLLSARVFAASDALETRAMRRSFHRPPHARIPSSDEGVRASNAPRAADRSAAGGASVRSLAGEIAEPSQRTATVNNNRSTILLALRTARPWYEGTFPKPHEVDATVRRARKALVEARNALTRDRPHPAVIVATFDQVSHGLSRFVLPSANTATIVQELSVNASRAAKGTSLSPGDLSTLVAELIDEAAVKLVETAAAEETEQRENDGAPGAPQWLLNVAAELARRNHREERHSDDEPAATKNRPMQTASNKQKMEISMVNKNSPLVETLKADATDAAWRTAGSQFVKLTREPLVGLLQRHLAPGDDAFRAKIAAFLETELGAALVASLLAAALSALPATAGEVPQKLARELRVRAMSDAGDVLADLLMGPLRQVIALYLQDPAGASAANSTPALPEGASESFEDTTVRERAVLVR